MCTVTSLITTLQAIRVMCVCACDGGATESEICGRNVGVQEKRMRAKQRRTEEPTEMKEKRKTESQHGKVIERKRERQTELILSFRHVSNAREQVICWPVTQ